MKAKRMIEKKKSSKGILKKAIIIIFIILIIMGGFILYKTYRNGGGLEGFLATMVGHDEYTKKNLTEFKVLLLGISKDIDSELSDTIIVASYNPNMQKATLLSVPRDTYVGKNKKNPTAFDKLNALYQKGPERTLDAINEITGLGIEYYMVIKNDALIELVDVIGGVEFDVPIDMDYDDSTQDLHIHLDAGIQKLNGKKAEQLVRFRHNNDGTTYPLEYGDNDLGRMRTQREFIKAVIKQTIKAKNILKLGDILEVAHKNIETNIELSKLKDYIPYVVEFNTENLKTETLPGTTDRIPKNTGLWFFIHNEDETEELIEELFYNELEQEIDNEISTNTISNNTLSNNRSYKTNTITNSKNNSISNTTSNSKNSNSINSSKNNITKEITKDNVENSEIKIEILNGSGISSKLTDVTKLLKKEGFNVYKTGTTKDTLETTVINKTNQSRTISNNIKKILGVGIVSNKQNSSSKVDYTIIIGKDYKINKDI